MVVKKNIKKIKKIHKKIKNSYNDYDLISLRSENYNDMREYFSVVLGINASFIGVVFAVVMYFILKMYFPIGVPYHLDVFPVLWVILSIVNVVLLEEYVRNRSREVIRYLFYTSLLNIMTANGFIVTGMLMLLSTYMLYEINERKRRNKR